jgi:hypothetical protein
MWLARAAPQSALPHESIALERREMRPDRVISEIQLFRQVFDRAGGASQDRDDLPARTLKKPFIQLHRCQF